MQLFGLFDPAVADKQATAGDFPALGIHGYEHGGVLNEQCGNVLNATRL